MKKLIYFLGIISLLLILKAEAQTVVEIQEEPKTVKKIQTSGCGYEHPLRVAGMIGNPPFGWLERHDERASKDLESYGLGREIAEKICEKLKISCVSTGFLSYNRAIGALKRGEIDVLLAAYYRPQDLGEGTSILYPGYFKNVFTVYFKKGKEFPVASFKDLVDRKGIIRREEHIYPLIYQNLPDGIDLTQVSTAKKAFEILMNEEADYLIGSPYSEEAELRRYKLNRDIVSSNKVLFDSNLFFVFTKNSDCSKLQPKFSQVLKEDFSANQVDLSVRKIIDDWGERFREIPGLLEDDEANTTNTATDTSSQKTQEN